MLKNISRLEHKIGDRIFHLLCDMDSPISEVKDALNVFSNYLDRIEEAARKAAEPPVEADPVQENVVEDATVVQE